MSLLATPFKYYTCVVLQLYDMNGILTFHTMFMT